ncbi:short-chain dehydrogenase/reductase SDR (plasmid) [Rhizorhabdus wittichii RW1]|uniref:Short-chain dehydrogenase/reductase SDR n=1 Tax=Rhizorhabdus wittichii (strain DSM 6014 / CCUG 31198 / JCM 15750 / NBRC 105917 / EY 4224 / RW1) TaxID=392499 RepID=A0A9J9LHC5_RHIWR|nr:short-chain dehydrogenase/reductase SDR [Rhizorhabdus wittichii RW1]
MTLSSGALASGGIADPSVLFDVRGKIAIITGASGAFGALAARVLAAAGAHLVLSGGNADALRLVADDCANAGASVETIVRRPEEEADAAAILEAAVARFGRADILVVASGMNDVAKIEDMTFARFDAVMQANVAGPWLMAQAMTRQLVAQGDGGKIVLMSSARGKLGHPAGYTAYCASKSAIDGIVRALGCELGGHGITVNAIAPTVFRSDLTAWMFEDSERAVTTRANLLPRIPLGRLGEPDDLAGPLLFLCSRASNFYTGHVLYADGGYTAG